MQKEIHIPWPEWEITKVIGRGGFGTVYEIQKDVFGKKESAALKVLSIPESQDEIDDLYSKGYDDVSISAHFKEYLEDIVSEYSIMVDLKGHANIVYCDEVKYVQHDDGIGWDVFIKMELLKPLNKITSAEYNEDEVIRLGKDLCNALIYCNQQNIIHRDIKPQNIFVSKNGSYKLGDFGVAKVSDKTMSGTKIGTYEYMAPEVYRAQRYGSRVDIYSLGLVMYWMMNQKCTPFLPLPPQIPTSQQKESARNRRLDGEQLPAPVNGSERLKAIVLKACAFDPKDRYASAQDMLNALQNMNAANPEAIPEPVDLDVHKEMTFEHTNHPAGKYLSIQVDAKEVHFSVPMDIKDGQTIHLTGKGKYDSSTGISGDLYITVHIKEAPPQPTPSNKRIIYVAIAAVAVVLAIIRFMPRNEKPTPPPETQVQEEQPEITTQPTTQHVHNWKDATYNDPKTCITCGATEGTIPPVTTPPVTTPPATQHVHSWKDATYNDPKTCTTCGATEGTPLIPEPKALSDFDITNCFGKIWTRGALSYGSNYHTPKDAPACWSDWSIAGYSSGTVKDNQGNQYDSGIHVDGDESANYYYEIQLDGKYTAFSGVCACPEKNSAISSYVYNTSTKYTKYFEVYGDGKLLYTSSTMRYDYAPQSFTIDVTNIRVLRIQYPATKGPNEIATLYDGMLS